MRAAQLSAHHGTGGGTWVMEATEAAGNGQLAAAGACGAAAAAGTKWGAGAAMAATWWAEGEAAAQWAAATEVTERFSP